MGAAAASQWEELIRHPEVIAHAEAPPKCFALDDKFFAMPAAQFSDSHKLKRGEYQVAHAWWHFTWHCAIAEVSERYPLHGLSSRVVVRSLDESWSLPSLYQYLFKRPQNQAEVQRSNQVLQWLDHSLVTFGALNMSGMGRRKKHLPEKQELEDIFDAQSRHGLWLAVLQAREKGGWPPLQSSFGHDQTLVRSVAQRSQSRCISLLCSIAINGWS